MPPSPSRASRCARCASPCRSWRGPASNARPGRGSVGAGVRVIDVAQRALFRLARTSGVGTGGAREGEGEGAQHQEETDPAGHRTSAHGVGLTENFTPTLDARLTLFSGDFAAPKGSFATFML